MAKNKEPTVRKTCCCCPTASATKTVKLFYKSFSPVHADGYLPWCISCIKKHSCDDDGYIDYNKFDSVLRQVDKPYLENIMQSAIAQFKKEFKSVTDEKELMKHGDRIIALYFKNLNSLRQYRAYTYNESSKNKETILADGTISGSEGDLSYSNVWRGSFSQRDIENLDSYYNGLCRDYKIITENHRDYARKIAKASLQMDKCYEDMINGVEGADTKYKNAREAFDTLSKSAKFSESTRSVNDVGISSFSKITEMVEQHNWVPTHMPKEKDVIDELLEALSTITKSV